MNRRPATAALTRADLAAHIKAARGALASHRRQCYRCRLSQRDVLAWCDDGYAMAQDVNRSAADLALLDGVTVEAHQPTL